MTRLSEQHITTIKDAAKKLTGSKRRAFQAQVDIDYLNSNPRLAEKTFGWDRKTVALGLNEVRTGIICVDNFKARGNKKTEVKNHNWKPTSLLWLSQKARLILSFKRCLNLRASRPKACVKPLLRTKAGKLKTSALRKNYR